MRIRLTLDIFREPKPAATPDEPKPPVIYDMNPTQHERANQWDHDTKPPIGFTRQETT